MATRKLTERSVVVLDREVRTARADVVAVEEPLEIRAAGEPLAVTMRTPGDDASLALGFLIGEGVVRSLADVGTIAHCGRPGTEGYGNAIDVAPGPGTAFDLDAFEGARRGTLTTAACGVCGRRSIDDLLARCTPVSDASVISAARVTAAPRALAAHQPTFDATGGVHGAAVLDLEGNVLAAAEDVGRHNAVDKVVGALVRRGLGTAPAILVVSGRASFEIVQKAAMARLPYVVSVSAASSLAVDLATRLGITLIGFTRAERFVVYTHDHRING